ncbi:calpain small subunit 2 [Varanus komodoensis]|uniref:calpain small subunit 2 n=1 Tax=Varanus komodoensis TaxID=61221 RepID=UPI001CF78A8F|nr:calpain small subunit 2 [Varanus komodoensis]
MFLAQALLDAAAGGGGGGSGGGGSGGGGASAAGGLLKSLGGGGGVGGALLKGLGGGGGGVGGALAKGLGGLLSGGGGGGGSGGSSGGGGGSKVQKGVNVMGLLGGLVNIISEAAAQYTPEPPPAPRSHFANVEANESEELRQFRRLFAQLAGNDMEVCPTELMNILNKVMARHQDLTEEAFSLDTCRSMVAVMDSDTTGKLDFYQFRYLWGNLKKWQRVFKQHCGPGGSIEMARLPSAFKDAGFNMHEQLYALMIRRYADEDGSMDFNNFISCLVRLDGMFRAFKALDRDGHGNVQISLQEWLQLTMYS